MIVAGTTITNIQTLVGSAQVACACGVVSRTHEGWLARDIAATLPSVTHLITANPSLNIATTNIH